MDAKIRFMRQETSRNIRLRNIETMRPFLARWCKEAPLTLMVKPIAQPEDEDTQSLVILADENGSTSIGDGYYDREAETLLSDFRYVELDIIVKE